MPGNFKKEDLRVIKTQKAFQDAIESLLERRKFRQITVNELCEYALTSRAAFYTHYLDKYDLLEKWFGGLLNGLRQSGSADVFDRLIFDNPRRMQNILYEADNETVGIIVNGLASSVFVMYDMLSDAEKATPEYRVLLHFCKGGLFEIVKWLSEQSNMQDFQAAQPYFNALLKMILEFHIHYKKRGSRPDPA